MTEQSPVTHECHLCGHYGPTFHTIEWVGGHGWMSQFWCVDRLACWDRIDKLAAA